MRGASSFSTLTCAALSLLAFAGCPDPTTDPVPDAGQTDAGTPPRCPTDLAATETRVLTTEGPVRGVDTELGVSFLGLRYGAAPAGDQRFLPATDPPCIERELIATTYAERCPQTFNGAYLGSEDCLFLNIFTPPGAVGSAELRPVLFFVHGGANVFGSGADQLPDGTHLYDGTVLASENDAVVVNVNYRLGALGFLVHEGLDAEDPRETSGNQALFDLVRALEWVQRNIAGFGGDPAHVLLFGESAGALNTCALLASPRARGLFSAALLESGGCFAASKAQRVDAARQLETATGCDAGNDEERLACLRGLDAETLVRAPVFAAPNGDPWSLSAGPVVDGDLLPDAPLAIIAAGSHNHVPLVVGSNADETSVWAPTFASCAAYEATVTSAQPLIGGEILARYPCAAFPTPAAAWIALSTDLTFTCPARRIARAVADAQDEPVFRYWWSQPALGVAGGLGAFHASELNFVFGHLRISGLPPDEDEVALSAAVRGYWTRFAQTGDPNGGDALAWPAFAPPDETFLQIDTPLTTGGDLNAALCDFWDTVPAGG